MKQFTLLAILCTLGVQALPDRTPYIINGHPAPHEPYNAYVLYINENNLGFFGGGSIISERHIVTAAQNIEGFVIWHIGLGSNVFAQLTMITTTTATPHPQFNPTNKANDVGIIALAESLVFTPTIAPIALPALNEIQLPLMNEQGSIVGFGFTTAQSSSASEFLMRSFQRVTNVERCTELSLDITESSQFCGEDTIEASNICNGDRGAGFVSILEDTPVLTGIASQINASCSEGMPTGYTRILAYRQWINDITQV
ncbi:collagenase-like [Wyeomyia smithii]|uniref:collagenase-like n=1 Tax=Wyeomyia smithii TaxID=174621 RepID=UPI0024680DF6|nr:collagenase-like [Wyeomyia smithii]